MNILKFAGLLVTTFLIFGCGDNNEKSAVLGKVFFPLSSATIAIPGGTPPASAYVVAGACAAAMQDKISSTGNPEEVNLYDTSTGYHNRDWWYWKKGVKYSFTWSPYVNGCQQSTYAFTPINKEATP